MQGFLLLNKPNGITSFGAVSKIKHLAHEKRVGHTGTLDPMATGVLPIFIGKATALSSYLLEGNKTYKATVKLGIETDSLDITGNITATNSVFVTNDKLLSCLSKFNGKIKQTPPMFSAIRKDGVRMYELARKGETIEIPEREVEIFDISLLSPINEDNEFSFSATVSKGTYIRSLSSDIGKALGCGATLTELQRTNVSGFDIKNAVNLTELTEENIKAYIKNEDLALPHLQNIYVTEKQAIRFTNGGQPSFERIKADNLENHEIVKVYFEDTFLGLGFADFDNQQLGIKCVINKV